MGLTGQNTLPLQKEGVDKRKPKRPTLAERFAAAEEDPTKDKGK